MGLGRETILALSALGDTESVCEMRSPKRLFSPSRPGHLTSQCRECGARGAVARRERSALRRVVLPAAGLLPDQT